MKLLLIALLCFTICNATGQIKFSNDSILILKPQLEKGFQVFYNIVEKTKITNEIFIGTSTIAKSLVSIKVLDTINGYWMTYMVHNVESKNKKYKSQEILDSLCIGIKLRFKMKKNGWYTDSASYFDTKSRLVKEIDSILFTRKFKIADSLALANTKKELLKLEGLESFMKPLMLFNFVYENLVIKKQRKFYFGYDVNIIGVNGAYGLIENKLQEINFKENSATVVYKFTANKESAAKEIAPLIIENLKVLDKKGNVFVPNKMTKIKSYKYLLDLKTCIPQKISYKLNSKFLAKIKNEFEMTIQ